jgi:uncharacterized membrane protein (UPF0127 family)
MALGALLALAIFGGPSGCDDACEPDLIVVGADGRVQFEACSVLADTEAERQAGLISQSINTDEALLMVFPTVGEVCISNADVKVPIDVIFVGVNATVLDAVQDVPAFSTVVHCQGGTQWVIETQAGIAVEVAPGDAVVLPQPQR